MNLCEICGRELSSDEVGLNKKLISRAAVKFLCKTHLAEKFGCGEELLDLKIRQYREIGCLLFSGTPSESK